MEGFLIKQRPETLHKNVHCRTFQNIYFTVQKMKFSSGRISSGNVTKSTVSCNLVTFTEGILDGKLHFLCSVTQYKMICITECIADAKIMCVNGRFEYYRTRFAKLLKKRCIIQS